MHWSWSWSITYWYDEPIEINDDKEPSLFINRCWLIQPIQPKFILYISTEELSNLANILDKGVQKFSINQPSQYPNWKNGTYKTSSVTESEY